MKKVCVVTAARSEYGALRWIIEELKQIKGCVVQLLVTGSHLSLEQGLTYLQIETDGFCIDKKIEMLLSTSTSVGIAKSMGVCAISIADAFNELSPDLLLVLGDRYELLPVCNTALIMQIPIAHISGGDITEGAIDDQIRNAVTMMSTLHFPGTKDSAKRIEEMVGAKGNIYPVGEPGLDNFVRLKLMSREEIARSLHLSVDKKWFLVTFHPETKESLSYNLDLAKNIISALEKYTDCQVIITKANADLGGTDINLYFNNIAYKNPQKFQLYSSLGQLRYLSLMKQVSCVIGNSSSGLIETPFLGKPVLNIGNRQSGRFCSENVITISGFENSIFDALKKVDDKEFPPNYYYGCGNTAKEISKRIVNYLNNLESKC